MEATPLSSKIHTIRLNFSAPLKKATERDCTRLPGEGDGKTSRGCLVRDPAITDTSGGPRASSGRRARWPGVDDALRSLQHLPPSDCSSLTSCRCHTLLLLQPLNLRMGKRNSGRGGGTRRERSASLAIHPSMLFLPPHHPFFFLSLSLAVQEVQLSITVELLSSDVGREELQDTGSRQSFN